MIEETPCLEPSLARPRDPDNKNTLTSYPPDAIINHLLKEMILAKTASDESAHHNLNSAFDQFLQKRRQQETIYLKKLQDSPEYKTYLDRFENFEKRLTPEYKEMIADHLLVINKRDRLENYSYQENKDFMHDFLQCIESNRIIRIANTEIPLSDYIKQEIPEAAKNTFSLFEKAYETLLKKKQEEEEIDQVWWQENLFLQNEKKSYIINDFLLTGNTDKQHVIEQLLKEIITIKTKSFDFTNYNENSPFECFLKKRLERETAYLNKLEKSRALSYFQKMFKDFEGLVGTQYKETVIAPWLDFIAPETILLPYAEKNFMNDFLRCYESDKKIKIDLQEIILSTYVKQKIPATAKYAFENFESAYQALIKLKEEEAKLEEQWWNDHFFNNAQERNEIFRDYLASLSITIEPETEQEIESTETPKEVEPLRKDNSTSNNTIELAPSTNEPASKNKKPETKNTLKIYEEKLIALCEKKGWTFASAQLNKQAFHTIKIETISPIQIHPSKITCDTISEKNAPILAEIVTAIFNPKEELLIWASTIKELALLKKAFAENLFIVTRAEIRNGGKVREVRNLKILDDVNPEEYSRSNQRATM